MHVKRAYVIFDVHAVINIFLIGAECNEIRFFNIKR